MEDSRTEQLSFRIEGKVSDRLDEAAVAEDRKRADLARRIFLWAFEQYQRAGSLHALRQKKPYTNSRLSSETHQELFTALEMILERAPSAVVKHVVEYIEERAGKYADEK